MPEISQIEEWSDTVEQRISALQSTVTSVASHVATLDATVADLTNRVLVLEQGDTTKPNPPPTWTAKFPGDVQQGTLRWGSAYGGNTEPADRYGNPGRAISRTYWDMSKTAGSVTRAKSDAAKGALPWVSYKVGTWATFTSGGQDAAFKKLLTDLDAIGKPIWLTVHHEPEGSGQFGTDEGTPTDNSSINNWKNAQKHVRDLIKSTGVRNIAFAPILMAWTWDTGSKRVAASWIDGMDGVWDFFGIDTYAETGQTLYQIANFKAFTTDLTKRGYRIGIGEWGVRGNQVQACHDEFVRLNFVGVAYFDSGLNSTTGSWELTADQLSTFNTICPTSPRV